MIPPPPPRSPAPADLLARVGMSEEELDLRYAAEIALCVKYEGDWARELAEHEAADDGVIPSE